MSKSEREQVMKFIEEHFPRLYLELDRMRERHPERQTRRMTRIASEVRELIEVMETNPERGALMIQERRLDMEIRHVVFRYRMADEAARAALRKDMRSLCEEIFDVRHRRRELEIRELEARISELKQRHEQASSMRDALVDREVTERLERGAMRPVGARDTRGAPESP